MRALVATILVLSAIPAFAGRHELTSKALNLGQLIGNAEICGAKIDEGALIAYMNENGLLDVDPLATFENAKSVTKFSKPSGLTCAATKATINKMGFSG